VRSALLAFALLPDWFGYRPSDNKTGDGDRHGNCRKLPEKT
jgi:hypothetical protein